MNGYVDVYKAAAVETVPTPEPRFYMVLVDLSGREVFTSGMERDKDVVMDRARKVGDWFGLEVRKTW